MCLSVAGVVLCCVGGRLNQSVFKSTFQAEDEIHIPGFRVKGLKYRVILSDLILIRLGWAFGGGMRSTGCHSSVINVFQLL